MDNIEEWLMIPSSDVSDDDLGPSDDENEKNFDRIFNEQLEVQIAERAGDEADAALVHKNAEEAESDTETIYNIDDKYIDDIMILDDSNFIEELMNVACDPTGGEEEDPDPSNIQPEADGKGGFSRVGSANQIIDEIIATDHSYFTREDIIEAEEPTNRQREDPDPDYIQPDADGNGGCSRVGSANQIIDRRIVMAIDHSYYTTEDMNEADEPTNRQRENSDPDYIQPEAGGSRGRRRGRGRGRPRGRPKTTLPVRGRQRKRTVSPPPPIVTWKKNKSFVPPNVIFDEPIPLPPENVEEMTPLDYFTMYIDSDIIEIFTKETNVYAESKGHQLNVTEQEIQQFIGILLYTGITKFSQYRMFWTTETRLPAVADIMPRNRFSDIVRNFHIVDNTTRVPGDKLFKIRPLINHITEVCRSIPPEENQSIDEHMVPFKGTSSMKMYVKNKPKKWGYKIFMRCSASGLMHDFAIYRGRETCPDYELGFSGDIVIELCSDLPRFRNFKLFTDNWFTSLQLFIQLKDQGIWASGVLRQDRTAECPLLNEKDLKKKGRGSYDYAVDTKNDLLAVRWYDNKQITMLTAIDKVEPVVKCKRWNKKEKKIIEIPRPDIVAKYNKSMGGVDLFGMLISLYRINLKGKRGYMRLAHWCFNVAVVNGWLLYRRHMLQLNLEKKYTLLDFQLYIAKALCTKGASTAKKSPGRPKNVTPHDTPKRGPKRTLPVAEARFDQTSHWAMPQNAKRRCAHCRTGQSRMKCGKCDIYLCLTNASNCFHLFHNENN